MILDDILSEIADELPPFSKEVLCGLNNRQINAAPDFIATVFDESSKFLRDLIRLKRYSLLDPERCIVIELNKGKKKFKIPTTLSHVLLYEYVIGYGDNQSEPVYIYTFFTHQNMLLFNGKRAAVYKSIIEKTFSRVTDKQHDGISVSPIRTHMNFGRRNVVEFRSVSSGIIYRQFLLTAKLYHGKMSKKFGDTTIMTYLLAKFGFLGTLKAFGISKKDIFFVDTIDQDTHKYEYFSAKAENDANEFEAPLYLKVKSTLLDDPDCRKFVVNLLYVMSYFELQTLQSVYDKENSLWLIILGTIISGSTNPLGAINSAEAHLISVDSFIDPITRDRFKTFGVDINDIYELLVYIFSHIDTITVNSEPQNLYTKRFDISKGILSEAFGKKIFHNMYELAKKGNPTPQDIKKALRLPMSMYIYALNKTSDDAQYISRSPEIVGDNWLFSCGMTKIRLGGKPKQRLHPSVFVVESGCTVSGKTINRTGTVNPHVMVDEHGGVIKPDFTEEFDALTEAVQIF